MAGTNPMRHQSLPTFDAESPLTSPKHRGHSTSGSGNHEHHGHLQGGSNSSGNNNNNIHSTEPLLPRQSSCGCCDQRCRSRGAPPRVCKPAASERTVRSSEALEVWQQPNEQVQRHLFQSHAKALRRCFWWLRAMLGSTSRRFRHAIFPQALPPQKKQITNVASAVGFDGGAALLGRATIVLPVVQGGEQGPENAEALVRACETLFLQNLPTENVEDLRSTLMTDPTCLSNFLQRYEEEGSDISRIHVAWHLAGSDVAADA
eukprot:CAMPEP_0206609794 /NCGR_PEP_ID=MMETSP0325_2-20121206/54051_1 /ASSEMBLY_ACC=CAM_ASM_000347 /TAXON_ID=2866 /ORGANISM="Crypthecodinium cohnii, Strain Seligo" /LENGTH=260 /DNA_ID=CAMNT_0054128253 /DNA_START=79 /DNA_END=859 /DNA_ORIENTATION=+